MHRSSLACLLVFAIAIGLAGCAGGGENPNPATFRAQPGVAIDMEGVWSASNVSVPDSCPWLGCSFEFSPGNLLWADDFGDLSRASIENTFGALQWYLNYADGRVFEFSFGMLPPGPGDGMIQTQFGMRGVAIGESEMLVEEVVRSRSSGKGPWNTSTLHYSLLLD
jgi:hypothetical protein